MLSVMTIKLEHVTSQELAQGEEDVNGVGTRYYIRRKAEKSNADHALPGERHDRYQSY